MWRHFSIGNLIVCKLISHTKIDNMQFAIFKLTSMHMVQKKKKKFPSQPQQNPRGVHEIGETSENSAK